MFCLLLPSKPSNQCLLFESKVYVGKSVSGVPLRRRASSSELKKNAVANNMKANQNCYNSISNAMRLRNAGAMTEGSVEGRATIGETGVAVGRSRLIGLES